MNSRLQQTSRRVVNWLNGHHVLLVVVLSVFHIGLACIHPRDSGPADFFVF